MGELSETRGRANEADVRQVEEHRREGDTRRSSTHQRAQSTESKPHVILTTGIRNSPKKSSCNIFKIFFCLNKSENIRLDNNNSLFP